MIPPPALIAISDTERAPLQVWLESLERLLAAAAPGSVLVLLRDRQLPVLRRRELGVVLRRATSAHGQLLSVGDRLDLALALGADAVHLSEDSVDVSDARAFASRHAPRLWISRACHEPADVAHGGADAVLLSPVAAPRKGRPALGTAGVARARAALAAVPGGAAPALYALGGVDASNAAEIRAAGADGVALIGALLEPGAPHALVTALGVRR